MRGQRKVWSSVLRQDVLDILKWCEMPWLCFLLHSNDDLRKKRKLRKKSERHPHCKNLKVSGHILCTYIFKYICIYNYIRCYLHLLCIFIYLFISGVIFTLFWTTPFFLMFNPNVWKPLQLTMATVELLWHLKKKGFSCMFARKD